MNERELIEWLRADKSGDADLETVLAGLRELPEPEAAELLSTLARNRSPVIRAWAATAAVRAVPGNARELVERLLDDRDPDVRLVALEELRRLDLSLVRKQLPRLVRQLESPDIWEPVSALWALADLRATDARASVERVIEQPAEPFHARVAQIVLAVIDGDEEGIATEIEQHDHIAMPWLARAASILATRKLRAVVEQAAAAAPDEECRAACALALEEWGRGAAAR
jgi:HEAT repeat protein